MMARNNSKNGAEITDDVDVAQPVRSPPAPLAFESAGIHNDDTAESPTVFVVDPDPVTARMVEELFHGQKLAVQSYTSGREFFSAYNGVEPGCLVLEQRIFDISGFQIQRRLAEQNQRLPMVFVAAGLDVATAVVLMRGGAMHVLEKPVRSVELYNAIEEALAADLDMRRREAQELQVRESIALLTRKERQLVSLVASAKSTKAIATELKICSRAVELRRRAVMKKLGLKSSLELLKFAVLAWQEYGQGLEPAELDQTKATCSLMIHTVMKD